MKIKEKDYSVDYLGDNIRKKLKEKNMTVNELTRKTGITERTLWSWIYRERNPKITTVLAVAYVLESTLDELLGGDE